MLRETELRRDRFTPGLTVRLGDGRSWVVPDAASPGIGGVEYELLVAGLQTAEDDDDYRRAALALMIFLLDFNYQLSSAEFAAILDGAPDEGRRTRLQAALRLVAAEHAAPARVARVPRPIHTHSRFWSWPWSRWFRFGVATRSSETLTVPR